MAVRAYIADTPGYESIARRLARSIQHNCVELDRRRRRSPFAAQHDSCAACVESGSRSRVDQRSRGTIGDLGLRIAKWSNLTMNRSKSAIRNPHFEITILVSLIVAAGCKSVIERQDVRPRVLRDVPARNLAYRLTPDVSPPSSNIDDQDDKFAAVANYFAGKRERTMRYCEQSSLRTGDGCLRFTAPRMNRVPPFASTCSTQTESFYAI